MHGGQRGGLVSHIAQAEADGDAVEARVGEGQLFRIRLHITQIAREPGVDELLATPAEHGGIDIGENDRSLLADLLGKTRRQISGAARDVQGALSRTEIRQGEGELLPQTMSTPGHEVVHQVVVARYRVEYPPNLAGLIRPGNAFVPEIR